MMAWSHYPDSLVTVFVLLVTLLAEVSEVAMLSSAFSFVLFFSFQDASWGLPLTYVKEVVISAIEKKRTYP